MALWCQQIVEFRILAGVAQDRDTGNFRGSGAFRWQTRRRWLPCLPDDRAQWFMNCARLGDNGMEFHASRRCNWRSGRRTVAGPIQGYDWGKGVFASVCARPCKLASLCRALQGRIGSVMKSCAITVKCKLGVGLKEEE
eukprot:IDg18896t1